MSLAGVAQETLRLLEQGAYTAPSGRSVSLQPLLDRCLSGTARYTPEELDALLDARAPVDAPPLSIEVTDEGTAGAARRLAAEAPVAALVFASARNPGGGFVRGAKAQEEDLARCSALYLCQRTQREFYDLHRELDSMLYTDQMLYSPAVPFFRDEALRLLEAPFAVSTVTAPAPNAGEALRRDPRAGPEIERALRRRAGKVLALMAHHGHRHLVLGAWGCGVFRNDPRLVADAFGRWLEGPFGGAFDRVVFAVRERRENAPTFDAFRARFAR